MLYRPWGRGASFSAVEDLVATVEAAEGHALVVVEDAVRPEATAAFDALQRLSDRSDVDVSFLFDARESEWRDPPGDSPLEAVDVTIEGMPRLLEADYRRLVEGFERTAGVDVDVPAERIREEIRTASPRATTRRFRARSSCSRTGWPPTRTHWRMARRRWKRTSPPLTTLPPEPATRPWTSRRWPAF